MGTAYLISAHEQIAKQTDKTSASLTGEHLMQAFHQTKSTLSIEDMDRYHRKYQSFKQRDGDAIVKNDQKIAFR